MEEYGRKEGRGTKVREMKMKGWMKVTRERSAGEKSERLTWEEVEIHRGGGGGWRHDQKVRM